MSTPRISLTPANATHRNVPSIAHVDANIAHVEVFDNEGDNLLTLYLSDGTHRWPIRSVVWHIWDEVKLYLERWCLAADFIDSRNDKTNPLPKYIP